jgi:hypothetical protein
VPGQLLTTYQDSDYMVARDVNLENITHFTITGWWRPNGGQSGFGALVSSGDWCAHCDYTEGLIIDYWGTRVWYKWPGNASNWGQNSGMVIPLNEWSYVALVITPDGATMYLNEDKYEHNIPLQPGDISDLYVGYGHYSHSFVGDIDEVTVWKRALTETEIRELRHLTKDQVIDDVDLVAYYQFNELVGENKILDHARINHGVLNNGATLQYSNLPVASGISETITNVNGPSTINSPTGIGLIFGSSGTYPQGDLVLNRLNIPPDVAPQSLPTSSYYWIINNYGNNTSFTALDELSIENLDIMTNGSTAPNYNIYHRNANGVGANWMYKATGNIIDSGLSKISFNASGVIQNFGQFTIENKDAIGWIGVVSTDWNNPANWGSNTIPGTTDNVIIPPYKPFDPIVNVMVVIKGLYLLPNANIEVQSGQKLDIKP